MLRFFRYALAALLLLAGQAHASFPPVPTYNCYFGNTQWNVTGYTDQAACAKASAAARSDGNIYSSYQYVSNTNTSFIANSISRNTGNVESQEVGSIGTNLACPTGSTVDSSNMCVCNAGSVQQGNSCIIKAACSNGLVKTMNFTAGWSRTGSTKAVPDTDYVGAVNVPGITYKSSCIADCTYSIGIDAVSATYVSNSPSATGLYRVSQDALVVGTGAECHTDTTTVADGAAWPEPAPAPCPGYVGQVDGKTTCVGTASSPLPKPSGDVDKIAKNVANNGDNGNPVAGEKPATGEGSGTGGVGRTPSGGVGTATGGPADAGAGGKGTATGTVSTPTSGTEQANCGAPGQAPCKIDETGTPGAFDPSKFSSSLDGAKTEADNARATISGSGDKGMFESMRSLLTSAPPIVGCTSFQLPRDMGSIDPCPVVDGVRVVMAYLWALGGFWLCVGMVKKVV